MTKPTGIEVENLAARMAAAEEEAFQEFAEAFGPRFRAFFISRGLRPSDAEDLAVSCVTDIALRIEKYQHRDDAGSFEGWVFTLARNFLADWVSENPRTDPLPENLEAADPSEETTERTESLISAVRGAMEQISDTDQLVVRLRYLEGERTFKEIGEILGIKPGTARVRLFRALDRLEAVLKNDVRISTFLKARKIEVS